MNRRKWTKQRVVAAIQDWHRKGVPTGEIWRADRALCMVSYYHFDSWREALAAAGLQSVRQQWSKTRVLNELKARYPHCQPWSRLWKGDSRLTAAAIRYFGSRHDALVAAGLRRGKHRTCRSWTPQMVIEAIRSRHRQGRSLTTVWREDIVLYAIARRTFGSWRQARQAAGLPLPSPRRWTRDGVIREIHSRRDQGLTLVGIWRAEPPLYNAAKRHFGNWRNALLAAGIEVKPRRRWTHQSVIDAIRDRHAQGLPLSRAWAEDKPLFRAAVKKFGNWEKALRAAGLQPKPRRRWSRQRVITQLQAWDRLSDENLQSVDPALAGAAARLFGTLDNALEAAGVEPKNRRWTNRRVINAIQDRYVQGQPIDIAGFGDTALRYAGFDTRRIKTLHAYSREGVTKEIRRMCLSGYGLSAARNQRRDRRLYRAAIQHFGTWKAALQAAGIDPKHAHLASKPRQLDKQKILQALQQRHQAGQSLCWNEVCLENHAMATAAKHAFGGWCKALVAAGIEPEPRRVTSGRKWDKERVIAQIQERQRQGKPLTYSAVRRDHPGLTQAARRYFGRWRAALEAAGIVSEERVERNEEG